MAFAGFRFAVELPEASKVEVIEVIEREKGSVTKTIHSKTDYVITSPACCDIPARRRKQAENLQIPIVSPEFLTAWAAARHSNSNGHHDPDTPLIDYIPFLVLHPNLSPEEQEEHRMLARASRLCGVKKESRKESTEEQEVIGNPRDEQKVEEEILEDDTSYGLTWNLPLELWDRILDLLHSLEIRKLCVVSKEWRYIALTRLRSYTINSKVAHPRKIINFLWQNCPLLRSLSLAYCDSCSDDDVAALPSSIYSLNLHNCYRVTNTCVPTLPPGLQTLDIGGTSITADSWKGLPSGLTSLDVRLQYSATSEHLKDLPRDLTDLKLGGCFNLGNDLAGLPPALRSLELSCCSIGDSAIVHLTRLSQLTYLELEGVPSLTDKGLEELAVMKWLTSLNLSKCCEITMAGLRCLPIGLKMRDEDCTEIFKTFKFLVELNLSGCYQLTPAVLRASLPPTLRRLDLSHCPRITPFSLPENENLAQLEMLNLETSQGPSKGFSVGVFF